MPKNQGKKTKEKKDKKSIIAWIVSHKDFITIILGLCAALYPILNTAYIIMYQTKCEKFYGIPGKYFDSNIDNKLLYLLCIITLILISVAPAFMKKYYKERGNLTKGYLIEAVFLSVITGMGIGAVNVYNLIEIMKQTYKTNAFFGSINNWLDNHACFTITIVIVLGSFSILGITLIDNLRTIKRILLKKIVYILLTISLTLSVIVMLYGLIFKVSISIEDKTKYEFVTYNNDEYVVLSSYHEKLLLSPFQIDKKGQYIFKTNQYLFRKPYEGLYQYKDIECSPLIIRN